MKINGKDYIGTIVPHPVEDIIDITLENTYDFSVGDKLIIDDEDVSGCVYYYRQISKINDNTIYCITDDEHRIDPHIEEKRDALILWTALMTDTLLEEV